MISKSGIGLLLILLSLSSFTLAQRQTIEDYKKAFSTFHLVNPDSTLHLLHEGRKEFTIIDDKKGLAEIAILLASLHNEMYQVDSAQKYFEMALALYTGLQDDAGMALACNGLGVIEGRSNRYANAAKYFLRALSAYERLSDPNGLVSCYIKLGMVNYLMKNTDKAIIYYKKGLSLGDKNVDPGNLITLNNNLGGVYLDQNMPKEALPYFEKALTLSDVPEFRHLSTMPLINIGIIKTHTGDTAGALTSYAKARKIAIDNQIAIEQARTSINISNIILRDRPDSAYKLLQEAISIANRLKDKTLQEGAIESLVDYYRQVGEFKLASNLQQTLALLKDTLYSVATAKEIAALQALHELDASNQEIAKLEAEKKARNRIKTISLSVGILSLAFAAIVLALNRKARKLNLALSQGKARLQHANDTKDKLFSIIGHDLKGPVNSMLALLGFYREASPEEKEFIINSFEETTINTATTLETLLNWGKSQIKGISFNPVRFPLQDIVKNKISFFHLAASSKNIHIHNHVPSDIVVTADIDHVRFVMRNLLSNAIKYCKKNGLIELNATFDPGKNMICCSVKDDGVGIPPEKLSGIFDPFNESTKGTENEVGHGIGLLLVKEFINRNNGEIWVESTLNEGTTFHFTLPGTIETTN